MLTFEIYVKEGLSMMSVSWARSVLRLNSRLERCPLLARAFEEGDLTQQQVDLLAGLVDRAIEEPWIRHAYAFLKQDVEAAKRLRAMNRQAFDRNPRPSSAARNRTFRQPDEKPTDP